MMDTIQRDYVKTVREVNSWGGSLWSVVPLNQHGLNTMEFLREFFAKGPDCDNWCLLSTSGIHGSYLSLDDNEPHDDGTYTITVMIVSPRVVRMHYGEVPYVPERDEAWLRDLVEKSLQCIEASQNGNRA